MAQAVWGMARSLCPDRERASIATVAALVILASSSSIAQIGAIVLGAIAGLWFCRAQQPNGVTHIAMPVSRRVGVAALILFISLLAGLPLLSRTWPGLGLFEAFYRSGALVFGGGHVVLPLLREAVVTPGWIGDDAFLTGYGAAQAVPGPLFTFAAYLGAVIGGVPGAIVGLVGIFLPGILVLLRGAAVLGWLSQTAGGTGDDARRQRRRRRHSGGRALQSGVDQQRPPSARFRHRAGRLRPAHGVACAAARGGRAQRGRRHRLGAPAIVNDRAVVSPGELRTPSCLAATIADICRAFLNNRIRPGFPCWTCCGSPRSGP
ncbi:chromate transport protein ChrA [Bradyrhizobium elkanii]